MASECSASCADASSLPASSASSPRPRPFSLAMAHARVLRRRCTAQGGFVAPEYFAGERQVGLRALRRAVQLQRRNAVARRFGEPDVAGNHGSVQLLAEVFL